MSASGMMNGLERLAYMADQIARNLSSADPDAAAQATADHIARFWNPRMRARLLAGLDAGTASVGETARAAFALLAERNTAPPAAIGDVANS